MHRELERQASCNMSKTGFFSFRIPFFISHIWYVFHINAKATDLITRFPWSFHLCTAWAKTVLRCFYLNHSHPLFFWLSPQSVRWKVWIFMSRRDTLIRWIMPHGSWSRTLTSKLITSSATRSECSVTITGDICVINWPGGGTDQWDMADKSCPL